MSDERLTIGAFADPNPPLAVYCFVRYRAELGDGQEAPVEFCAPIDPARVDEARRRCPDMAVVAEPARSTSWPSPLV